MRSMPLVALSLLGMAFMGQDDGRAQNLGEKTEPEQETQEPSAAALPSPGVVKGTGYVGITPGVTASDDQSISVSSVVAGSPAAESGLLEDDIIVAVNGQRIESLQDLDRAIQQPPGTELNFEVRRKNVLQQFDVTVGERPSSSTANAESTFGELPAPTPTAQAPPVAAESTTPDNRTGNRTGNRTNSPNIQHGRPYLGISVVDVEGLDAAARRRFGVSVRTGAVITGLTPGAPAAQAGLPLGGVIVSINETRVGTAQELVDLVQTMQPGQEIEVTYWEGDRMGRKKLHVGPAPATPPAAAPARSAPMPSPDSWPQRRSSDRPLLDALGQLLDNVLPPGVEAPPPGALPSTPPSGGAFPPYPPPPNAIRSPDTTLPTPPPPSPQGERNDEPRQLAVEPPAAKHSATDQNATELESLRKQVIEMQRQLDALRQRVQELEHENAGEPATRPRMPQIQPELEDKQPR